MLLSDRTLKLLIESGAPSDRLVEILRSLDADWNVASGKDHDRAITFAANCLEGGVAAEWILSAVAAYRDTWADAPAGYVRRLPANWSDIRARVFARDGETCRYCGVTQGPFHIDHITPLRWGGTNDEENLCVACPPCNLSKKDRTVEQWRAGK